MQNIKTRVADVVSSGLEANTSSNVVSRVTGRYVVECFDSSGKLRWSDESQNLVVNVGLQYMAGAALTATTPITTWYIGLYGSGATNSPASTDTLASHPGWTEITPYTGNRKQAVFAAATNANPSVVTNSASTALFNINTTAVVGGAFLCSVATGTSGLLFSAADFSSPGDRTAYSGDLMRVSYTCSVAP